MSGLFCIYTDVRSTFTGLFDTYETLSKLFKAINLKFIVKVGKKCTRVFKYQGINVVSYHDLIRFLVVREKKRRTTQIE